MRIRAHNLLCILGFVGKGYSPAFVANMAAVVRSLDDATDVTVLAEPDAVCRACPNLADGGCSLRGPGTEEAITAQDLDVLGRLDAREGATLPWGELLARIRRRIAPDDLDGICGACPWLPLGHCREGLARLRRSTP